MKKHFFLLAALLMISFMANAQLIKDRTNGKITVGADLYTDINTGSSYENFNLRAINQGFDAYITYNFPMGESKHTASLGFGVTSHNYYIKDAWLSEPYAEIIEFTPISSYTKSKINFNYFDIPLEVNFRIADKFKISAGVKVGFLMGCKSKCIGKINEKEILTDAVDYIKEECGSDVVIHTDDSYDPQNKAKNAMPYKPAIFME